MRRPIETLADGLGHPEGPDILPDGRIVFVETYTSKILAWSAERGMHDYARLRRRPERLPARLATAPLYITQNGGTVGAWRAEVMSARASRRRGRTAGSRSLSPRSTASPLQAPNDLTFTPDGRLYFTDPADYLPNDRKPGPAVRAQAGRQRAAARDAPRRLPERHRGRGRRVGRVGRVLRPRHLPDAPRRAVRAHRRAARGAHPRRPQGRRRRRPVDHDLHARRDGRHPRRRRHVQGLRWRPAARRSTASSTRGR